MTEIKRALDNEEVDGKSVFRRAAPAFTQCLRPLHHRVTERFRDSGSAMPKRSTLRLTTRSVAALPATGRDAVHWDRDLPSFGVRVQRNGRKVYVVQSRGPAGLKRVTLGPVAGKAIDQRRREAAEVIDRIKRGLEPIPPKPEPTPTVADLAARSMRAYVKVHCKPKTEKLYRTATDRHIVPGARKPWR